MNRETLTKTGSPVDLQEYRSWSPNSELGALETRNVCLWPKADCQFRGVGSVSMTAIDESGHSEMAILAGLVERPLYARKQPLA